MTNPLHFFLTLPLFSKKIFLQRRREGNVWPILSKRSKKRGRIDERYIYIKVGSLSAYRFVDQPIERPSFLRAYTCRIQVSVFIHGATTMIQEFIHKSRVYL